MSRQFYTERDIVDMFKGGIMSLEVTDQVVLTELAYEKARSLGMRLVTDKPDNPPCAPVRPYISQRQAQRPAAPVAPSTTVPLPSPDGTPLTGQADEMSVPQRIRSTVIARLGDQVDANLLDVIIKRVLNATGVK
jgi:hypothetical protein